MTPIPKPAILIALWTLAELHRRDGKHDVDGSVLKALRALDECPLTRDEDADPSLAWPILNAARARGVTLEETLYGWHIRVARPSTESGAA